MSVLEKLNDMLDKEAEEAFYELWHEKYTTITKDREKLKRSLHHNNCLEYFKKGFKNGFLFSKIEGSK